MDEVYEQKKIECSNIKRILMDNQLKTLVYSVFIYLNMDTEPVTIFVYLMLADTVLGAIKVLRINPTKFSFKELLLGFVVKPALLVFPMTIALIGKGIDYNLTILVSLSIKILIVSEGISIISNLISIKTKEETQDFDIITKLLKKTRSFLMGLASKLLNTLGKDK